MKPEKSPENDGAMSKLLQDWKVESSLPPRFNEQVWHRIAKTEPRGINPLASWRDWLARTFARPAMAISYVTILLLAGVTLGFWQGRANSQRTTAELGARYVQLMNSYDFQR